MRGFIVGLLIVIAVFSAYAGVRHNGFVRYDDHSYITENPQTLQGLTFENVRYAFTTFDTGNWHPITWLSLMLDWHLFGDRPALHHFENVAWHAANALLLLILLNMMTGRFWPSVAIALIWAVHPLRVESVAWASERKDLLSAFFGLLCMLAYARYVLAPSVGRYLLVMLCLAIGLLCKPMLVTWPCLLLVLDFWPFRRIRGLSEPEGSAALMLSPLRLIVEKIPLLAIVAASSVVTVIAQHSVGAVGGTDVFSLTSRMANATVTVARYLSGTFWPTDMAVLYPYVASWPTLIIVKAAILIVVITAIALVARRWMPWLVVGWLWFLGTLMPVIGLVQVGVQAMADRYTYIPQIGIVIMFMFTLWLAVRQRPVALGVVTVVIAIPLWLQTRHQVGFWRNSETLYQRALDVTTDNWIMHNNVGGMALLDQEFLRAERHFAEAMRIAPTEPGPAKGLADTAALQGHLALAISRYEHALRLQPNDREVLNNLAWLLATTPPPHRNGPRAVEFAARACQIAGPDDPNIATYLDTAAAALAAAGRYPEAVQTATRAIQLANLAGQRELADDIDQRLRRYRHNQQAQ